MGQFTVCYNANRMPLWVALCLRGDISFGKDSKTLRDGVEAAMEWMRLFGRAKIRMARGSMTS